LEGVTNIFAIP